MALHPDRYPGLPPALLWARLPLQPLAIWWALRATRRAQPATGAYAYHAKLNGGLIRALSGVEVGLHNAPQVPVSPAGDPSPI